GCLPAPFHSHGAAMAKEQTDILLNDLEGHFQQEEDLIRARCPICSGLSAVLQEQTVAELEKLGEDCRPELEERLATQPRLEVALCIEQVLAAMDDDECCCPDGGSYHLSADGMSGECSHHGHAHFQTPNLEIPITTVSGSEAEEYDAFRKEYNQY